MRPSFAVAGVSVGWLLVIACAGVQHQRPWPTPSVRGDPASPGIILGRLAEVTTQTVLGLEAAIRDRDEGLARRWADGYVQSMAALIEYVEGGDPAGMRSDLRRLEEALGRQGRLLHRLAARSPPGFRKLAVLALDSGVRARQVVRAAIQRAGRTKGPASSNARCTQMKLNFNSTLT